MHTQPTRDTRSLIVKAHDHIVQAARLAGETDEDVERRLEAAAYPGGHSAADIEAMDSRLDAFEAGLSAACPPVGSADVEAALALANAIDRARQQGGGPGAFFPAETAAALRRLVEAAR